MDAYNKVVANWRANANMKKFEQLRKMYKDAGHYIAAGHTDLIPLIEKLYKRILSMHTKDIQTPANGKGNIAWGTGDTPIGDILQLIRKNKYKFPETIELEYQVPEGSEAVKEVQKCLKFCIKALV